MLLGCEVELCAADDCRLEFWRGLVGSVVLPPGMARLYDDPAAYGLDCQFKRRLGAALPPGSSAVLIVVPAVTQDHVKSVLSAFGGTLVTSTLDRYPLALR